MLMLPYFQVHRQSDTHSGGGSRGVIRVTSHPPGAAAYFMLLLYVKAFFTHIISARAGVPLRNCSLTHSLTHSLRPLRRPTPLRTNRLNPENNGAIRNVAATDSMPPTSYELTRWSWSGHTPCSVQNVVFISFTDMNCALHAKCQCSLQ